MVLPSSSQKAGAPRCVGQSCGKRLRSTMRAWFDFRSGGRASVGLLEDAGRGWHPQFVPGTCSCSWSLRAFEMSASSSSSRPAALQVVAHPGGEHVGGEKDQHKSCSCPDVGMRATCAHHEAVGRQTVPSDTLDWVSALAVRDGTAIHLRQLARVIHARGRQIHRAVRTISSPRPASSMACGCPGSEHRIAREMDLSFGLRPTSPVNPRVTVLRPRLTVTLILLSLAQFL